MENLGGTPRIGVGIVGLGVAALTGHLPVLTDGSDFRLLAVADRDPARLRHVVERWRAPRACPDLDSFFETPGLEAVVIATPPDSHFEIAQAAILHRKHVLVEKPLAPTRKQCASLVRLAARERVVLSVGHEKRFHPTFEKVRAMIQNGVIGVPFYCGVHWASNVKLDPQSLVPEGFLPGYQWRWSNPAVGGGIIQDHLPHYVDLIQNWTKAAPAAVYSQSMNIARDWLGWPSKEAVWEDLGLVVVRFSNGLVMRFETGTVGRSLSPIWSLGSGMGEWTEYGYLLGTKGQLLFDLLPWHSSENGRIAIWRVNEAASQSIGWSYVEQPEPARCHGSPSGAARVMFESQSQEFAKAIRGQPSRIATGEDGMIAVAAVEAAYVSAQTHQECPVDRAVTPIHQ